MSATFSRHNSLRRQQKCVGGIILYFFHCRMLLGFKVLSCLRPLLNSLMNCHAPADNPQVRRIMQNNLLSLNIFQLQLLNRVHLLTQNKVSLLLNSDFLFLVVLYPLLQRLASRPRASLG